MIYECLMLMLMLCKSSYARLTPEVLHSFPWNRMNPYLRGIWGEPNPHLSKPNTLKNGFQPNSNPVGPSNQTLAPFGLPYIQLVRLLFSAGTVFFSHNNSARTVFSASFSQDSASRTGPKLLFTIVSSLLVVFKPAVITLHCQS